MWVKHNTLIYQLIFSFEYTITTKILLVVVQTPKMGWNFLPVSSPAVSAIHDMISRDVLVQFLNGFKSIESNLLWAISYQKLMFC